VMINKYTTPLHMVSPESTDHHEKKYAGVGQVDILKRQKGVAGEG
jgi:hypothetical protein